MPAWLAPSVIVSAREGMAAWLASQPLMSGISNDSKR